MCVLLTAYSVILVVFLGGYRDYSGAVGFINSVFFSISVHKLLKFIRSRSMSTAIPGVTSLHAGGSSVCSHEPRASHQTSFEDHSYVTYPGPSFPLHGSGLSDMVCWLQGLEDSLTLNDSDKLTAMCIAVSKSKGCPTYPASKGAKYTRANCSFDPLGPHYIKGGRFVYPDADKDLISWDLPSHGSKGKRCGPLMGGDGSQAVAGCCGETGYVAHYGKLRRFHCNTLECIDWHCLKSACIRRAKDSIDRLLAVQALYPDPRGRARLVHIIYSWDPSKGYDWVFSRKAFNKKLREAYSALRGLGVRGGVAVFHPFSWKGEERGDKKLFPDSAFSEGLEWTFRPHLHVVAYAFVKGTGDHYAATGDVVHTIYKNESGGRLGPDDVQSILAYSISHAGAGRSLNGSGKALDVTRAFGLCKDVAKLEDIVEHTETECPVCKGMEGVHRPLFDLHDLKYSGRMGAEPLLYRDKYGLYCRKAGKDAALDLLSG